MTNKEKFKEVFGYEPDTTECPHKGRDCLKCPHNGKWDCSEALWEDEYKEPKHENS